MELTDLKDLVAIMGPTLAGLFALWVYFNNKIDRTSGELRDEIAKALQREEYYEDKKEMLALIQGLRDSITHQHQHISNRIDQILVLLTNKDS